MRGVYEDIIVKVPKQTGVFINWSDKNKVIYSQGSTRDKNGNPKRIGPRVIGYAISSTEMHPNKNFKIYFPSEWKIISGEDQLPDIKKFGINLAISTICENKHICSTLNKSIQGFASAILDFSAYCIFFRDAVIEHFGTSMEDQLLFSEELHDANFYYDLFKNQIDEKQTIVFRREWAKECIAQGDTEVWLCIDGSNDDCECTGVEFVERGFAKSHRNVDIVGYSFAVTENGKPVTYELYRGGLIDQKALKSVIAAVEAYGFHVKGVILDRGYCYYNVFEYLRLKKILFIIMLKNNVPGYLSMMEKYGNILRLLPGDNWIEGTCLYGASDKMKLFKGSKEQETVCLFYDIDNASGRTMTLLKKLNKTLIMIRKAINKNTQMPAIDKEIRKYLDFVYPEESATKSDKEKGAPVPLSAENDHADPCLTAEKLANEFQETCHETDEQSITDKEEEEAEKTGDDNRKEAIPPDNKDEKSEKEVRRPTEVKVRRDELQKCTDKKGFFAIASSESLSSYETYLHYSHRDVSESTYMIFKGQEGFAEVRLHTAEGIESKFLVGFVTSIIRYYLEQTCNELEIPTNEMIRKLNLIKLKKSSDIYYYSDETDTYVKKFLKSISVASDWADKYVKAENRKLLGTQTKKEPRKRGPKTGSHHRKYDENGNEIKRKPGPKPGSHRKQRYNKDGSLRQKPGPKAGSHHIGKYNKDGSERKKPGPKLGSKHKKSGQDVTHEHAS